MKLNNVNGQESEKFMEKFKVILAKVIDRFKSPVVWGGIIAVVGLVFTTAGYSLGDVGSWGALWGVIVGILSSPEELALIIVAIFAFLNNPATKSKF